jgi:hypothetical protein
MSKKDPRVDAYISKSAEFAQPILKRLRALVHDACPAVEETIKWSMPSYTLNGKILCGMAAFKAHATFGFWHQGVTKMLEKEFGRSDEAMGHMGRITSMADLPKDADLKRYIRRAAELISSGKYIEWITEAKREETRATRLEKKLEWLAEGKQRNWKYMNC